MELGLLACGPSECRLALGVKASVRLIHTRHGMWAISRDQGRAMPSDHRREFQPCVRPVDVGNPHRAHDDCIQLSHSESMRTASPQRRCPREARRSDQLGSASCLNQIEVDSPADRLRRHQLMGILPRSKWQSIIGVDKRGKASWGE